MYFVIDSELKSIIFPKDTPVVESREERRKRRHMEKKVSKTLDEICKDMTNSFFVDEDSAASRLAALNASAASSEDSASMTKGYI